MKKMEESLTEISQLEGEIRFQVVDNLIRNHARIEFLLTRNISL